MEIGINVDNGVIVIDKMETPEIKYHTWRGEVEDPDPSKPSHDATMGMTFDDSWMDGTTTLMSSGPQFMQTRFSVLADLGAWGVTGYHTTPPAISGMSGRNSAFEVLAAN